MRLKPLIIVLLIFLLGCKANDIKIGVVLPLTGEHSSVGESMKEGFELARDEINSANNINGRKIKLIYEDDKCSPELTQKSIEELRYEKKVVAFLGPYCVNSITKAARFSLDNKVVFVSSGYSMGKLTEYYFSTKFPLVREVQYLARFAKQELNLQKLGLIYDDDYKGKVAYGFFRNEFESLGGNITAEEVITYDEDFNDKLNKIVIENPDGIFIGSSRFIDMINQLIYINYEGYIFLDSDMQDEAVLDKVNNFDNIYYSYPVDERNFSQRQTEFALRYKNKYNKDYDVIAADSYDALNLLTYGLRRCDTIDFDGGCVTSVIRKIKNYDGVSTNLTFEKNLWGFDRNSVFIKTINDGRFIKTIELTIQR